MADQNEDKPRIIVDDDWKQQARREKEEADRAARQAAGRRDLPPASLMEVVQMIAIQASLGLGGLRDPQTGQAIPPDLGLAKHYIDLLEVLEAKTAGRVDPQEKAVIEGTLQDLRLLFVQVAGLDAGAAAEPPKPD